MDLNGTSVKLSDALTKLQGDLSEIKTIMDQYT